MTDYERELRETGAIKGKEFIEFDPGLELVTNYCELCCFSNGRGGCLVDSSVDFCFFREKPTVYGIWVEEKK